MDDEILRFKKQMDGNKIKICINRYIQSYIFDYIQSNFDEQNYDEDIFEEAYKNIKESNIIFVEQFIDDNNFIIIFKNSIFIIQQKSILFLRNLFLCNDQIIWHFDKKSKSSFSQNFKNNFKESNMNIDFSEETKSLFECICQKNHKSIMAQNIFKNILSHISKYLIIISYSKCFFNRSKIDDFHYKPIEIKEEDFVSLKTIGTGSICDVYLIYYIKEQKLYVNKKIKNQSDKYLMDREYNNYLKVNHPLIPKLIGTVHYLFQEYSIVIEYIYGQTLDNYIIKNKLDDTDKVYIITQLMAIIEYLHLNHFNYRDLKPDNIMIDVNKNVFLFDLNKMIFYNDASKYAEFSNDFPFIYAGSEYDNGECSFISDVFSLGKVIYFITHMKAPTNENCIQYAYESQFYNIIYLFINLCIKDKESRPTISKFINLFFAAFCDTLCQFYSLKTIFDINKKLAIKYYDDVEKNDIYIQNCIEEIRIRTYEGKNVNIEHIMKSYSGNSSSANQRIVEEEAIIGEISKGNGYLKCNISKVLSCLSFAADKRNPVAIINMCYIYLDGSIARKNFKESFKYIQIADNLSIINDNAILLFLACFLSHLNFNILDETFIEKMDNDSIFFVEYFIKKIKNIKLENIKIDFPKNLSIELILGELCIILNQIDEGIKYLKIGSEQNLSEAQYMLGLLYLDHENINDCIKYLTLASNQNYLLAQIKLGFVYLIKLNEFNKAFIYLKLAADQNDSCAQFYIGNYYLGLNFFSENNLLISCEFIIDFVEFIKSNKNIDFDKGIYYLTKSAKQNIFIAQLQLGILYIFDMHIPHDYDKGIYYLTLAAKQNNSIAQILLGAQYLDEDIKKGEMYLKSISKSNDAFIQVFLGFYYKKSGKIHESIHFLESIAKFNLPEVLLSLGDIFSNKKNKDFDMTKAIFYYKRAALLNEPHSQYKLGLYYIDGSFVPKNVNYGLELIIKAAESRVFDAFFSLGFIYHEGKLIKCDIEKAIHYYKEGSSLNDQYSKNNLGVIYKNGFFDTFSNKMITKNIGYSIELFNEAIKQKKDILAIYNLSTIYLYENPVNNNNIDNTIKLLIQSSKDKSIRNVKRKISLLIELLCYVLIYRYECNVDNIIKRLQTEYNDCSKNIFNSIVNFIFDEKLNNPTIYRRKYEKFRHIDYVYDLNQKIIVYNKLLESKKVEDSTTSNNLTKDFYDGFGINFN